ncbi:MAG: efflux RND transporter periplasmic adaptor subunit [Halioglobus sp.]|nr:efflux RND transporter periplasmic adaptor subunit [Halioglobus sp.]
MLHRTKHIIGASLMGAALALGLSGCEVQGSDEREVIYQPVEAIRVTLAERFEVTRLFTGVVQPAQTADIAFEFGGTVQAVLVNEGDRVEEGDLLARLDTALLEIERRQLLAQLAEAEATLRLTDANLKRQGSLEADGYASRQRRDELEANRDAIEARMQHLQAALDGNLVRQEKAHLLAPFAGVIGERFMEQGSAAAPGVPALTVLETGRLEARVGVPRQLAQDIHRGDEVDLAVAGEAMRGQVLAVGAELKARSHAVNIRIAIESDSILAGTVVELTLRDYIDTPGFVLPDSALTASLRGLWRVYVLAPVEGGLYKVEARDLQLRYSDSRRAYVEGGVRDGELVIASGTHRVVPGQLVRINQDPA